MHFYVLSLASFATLRELRLCFLRVLSIQKEPPTAVFFDSFFPAQEMSYYGGPELPEALPPCGLPTISMGPTGDFWIDPIKSRESG